MANIEYIDFYSSIGDSLSAIHSNFLLLDNNLKNIETELASRTLNLARFMQDTISINSVNIDSAPNILLDTDPLLVNIPFLTTTPANYIENITFVQDTIRDNLNYLYKIADNINLEKHAWEQALTIVEANSSRWIRPISLMYPCIVEEPSFRATPAIRDEINQWLNKHFPVINIDGLVNYIDAQLAHVSFTYKLYNVHPNATDITIHNNIQTIVFAVKNCTWQVIDYLIGDQIAPNPTSAPTQTPTRTPTRTPVPTPTITGTPAQTPTPTLTPTPTFVDYFSMQLVGVNADTGSNNGSLVMILRCYHKGFFAIKIGSRAFSADHGIPVVCDNLPAGKYIVTITNYNTVIGPTPKVVIAELIIPLFAGGARFIYKGRSLNLNDVILAEDRLPPPT